MKVKQLLMVFACLFASIGSAHAVALYTASFDPEDDIFLSTTGLSSTSFTLDIRPGSDGFRPGIDTILGATLFVSLVDDFDLAREEVSFAFDGSAWTMPASASTLLVLPKDFTFDVANFLSNGLLDVTLRATRGDFFFDRATLAATGVRAVPEPATLTLAALALLLIGMATQRAKRSVR